MEIMSMSNASNETAFDEYEAYYDFYALPCTPGHFYPCSVSVISSVVCIAGVFGNIVTIYQLASKKEFRASPTFVCIILLAISDFVSLITIFWEEILSGYYFWSKLDLPKYACIVYVLFHYSPFLLSCYCVAMLATVRYIAVAYPLSPFTLKKPKTLVLLFLVAYIIILTTLSLLAFFSEESLSCYDALYESEYAIFIFSPVILCTVAYLIVLHILKVRNLHKSLSSKTSNMLQSFRRINTVICIVTVIFIISQLPYCIFDAADFIQRLTNKQVLTEQFQTVLFSCGIVFFIANHSINPFIYFIFFYLKGKKRPSLGRSSPTTSTQVSSSFHVRSGRDKPTSSAASAASLTSKF